MIYVLGSLLILLSMGYILECILSLFYKPKMKIAIVGSRSFCDYDLLEDTLSEFIKENGKPEKIILGGARGADNSAVEWTFHMRLAGGSNPSLGTN